MWQNKAIYNLFTWSKQKWLFWRAGFYLTSPSNLKSFQKALIGWKKAGPPNKPFLFDHVNRLIICLKRTTYKSLDLKYSFICKAVSSVVLWISKSLIIGLRTSRLVVWIPLTGAAPRGGLGSNSSPNPLKDHFCKSSKTDEKIVGVWEGWHHQPYLNFNLSLSQVVFKDRS